MQTRESAPASGVVFIVSSFRDGDGAYFDRTDCRAYSKPCTFGMACVGWICGAAGFASTTGAAACGTVGASAGLACTSADCCGGSGAGLAASGFISPARGGAAVGIGTEGVRLATCGMDAGGRGGPLTALTVGGPTGP